MLLVTSVPPVFSRKDPRTGEEIGHSYLASCIASWRRNGFRPISINRFDEVDAIKASGLIECLGVSNEEARFPQRFGPSLGAILDSVPPTEPVAIINADIYMLSGAASADVLSKRARNAIVAARRIDVTHLGASRGEIYGLGYDLTAFTPAAIPKARSNSLLRQFQLGAPWWDYVLPYSCSEELPAFRIKEPFLTHALHPNRWDNDTWHTLAIEARKACASIKIELSRPASRANSEELAIASAFIRELFGNRFTEIEIPLLPPDPLYRTCPRAINTMPRSHAGAKSFARLLGESKAPNPGERDPVGRKIRRTIRNAVFRRTHTR